MYRAKAEINLKLLKAIIEIMIIKRLNSSRETKYQLYYI